MFASFFINIGQLLPKKETKDPITCKKGTTVEHPGTRQSKETRTDCTDCKSTASGAKIADLTQFTMPCMGLICIEYMVPISCTHKNTNHTYECLISESTYLAERATSGEGEEGRFKLGPWHLFRCHNFCHLANNCGTLNII